MAQHALTKPVAILMDWDNTLVDTWPVIHQALHDTMSAWDMRPWSLEEVKLKVGKSMREAFPELFGEDWERAGEHYIARYRYYHLEQLKPLEGTVKLLEKLKDMPVATAVVSNKRSENLRVEVTHLGWDHYFDTLVGAGDALKDKPAPDPALLALDHLSLPANASIWFLGDTITDLECAHNAKLTAILYGDVAPESEGMYRGFPFHAHCVDHDALLGVLDKNM